MADVIGMVISYIRCVKQLIFDHLIDWLTVSGWI